MIPCPINGCGGLHDVYSVSDSAPEGPTHVMACPTVKSADWFLIEDKASGGLLPRLLILTPSALDYFWPATKRKS